jgi:hypothetical protein
VCAEMTTLYWNVQLHSRALVVLWVRVSGSLVSAVRTDPFEAAWRPRYCINPDWREWHAMTWLTVHSGFAMTYDASPSHEKVSLSQHETLFWVQPCCQWPFKFITWCRRWSVGIMPTRYTKLLSYREQAVGLLVVRRHLVVDVAYQRYPHLGRVVASENVADEVGLDLHVHLLHALA